MLGNSCWAAVEHDIWDPPLCCLHRQSQPWLLCSSIAAGQIQAPQGQRCQVVCAERLGE